MDDVKTLKKKSLIYFLKTGWCSGERKDAYRFVSLLKKKPFTGKSILEMLRKIVWGWPDEERPRAFWNEVFEKLGNTELTPEENETIQEFDNLFYPMAHRVYRIIEDYVCRLQLLKHSITRQFCRVIAYLDSLNILEDKLVDYVFENYDNFQPVIVDTKIIDLLENSLPYYQAKMVIGQINPDLSSFRKGESVMELSGFEKELLEVAKKNIAIFLGTEIKDIIMTKY